MKKKTQALLCIDPGIDFGWAIFGSRISVPCVCGTFKSEGKDFWSRLEKTAAEFNRVLGISEDYECEGIACEYPAFFGSEGGQVAARSGSLVKLAVVVGTLYGVCLDWGIAFRPVGVNEWKGNLSKEIVKARIEKILGSSALADLRPKEHAWDAIGIGLYCRGKF